MMGGIPTNVHGQALTLGPNGEDQIIEGLFAAGECACVSVHGANRLGANSLLDIVVFGRAVGLFLQESLREKADVPDVNQDDIDRALQRLQRWENSSEGEAVATVRQDLQRVMQEDFGVFRDGPAMESGLKRLEAIRERLSQAHLTDKSKVFNTARMEALELDNLMSVAMASAFPAARRQESRGAHSRLDFPNRDDKNWLKHSVYFEDGRLAFRTVNMQPNEVDAISPTEGH
jgi:succinate dehydrogenase / fumarate reductase, flavoprotein subunit